MKCMPYQLWSGTSPALLLRVVSLFCPAFGLASLRSLSSIPTCNVFKAENTQLITFCFPERLSGAQSHTHFGCLDEHWHMHSNSPSTYQKLLHWHTSLQTCYLSVGLLPGFLGSHASGFIVHSYTNERVFVITRLEYWTGVLDWTTGLSHHEQSFHCRYLYQHRLVPGPSICVYQVMVNLQ